MKILVLGGEGMLGHKMFQTLRREHVDVCCTLRGSLDGSLCSRIDLYERERVLECVDAMDLASLDRMLETHRPRVVVNCIGVIKQRETAALAIPTITLNSLLPHRLARVIAPWGGRLFHFSTDCVFNGRTGGYTEASPSDAEDLYGKSKFLGEVVTTNALTLRTSIIGRELSEFKSLLEWFLSQRGGQIRGFTKTIYSGVTTNYISSIVSRLITEHPTLSGLYQVTSMPISKHDLLCMLREAYRIDVAIDAVDGEVSDRSMNGERFTLATGYRTPPWQELVQQLASDPTPYEAYRQQ